MALLAQQGREGERRLHVAGLEAEGAPEHLDAIGAPGSANCTPALGEDDGRIRAPAACEVDARGLHVEHGLERELASRMEIDAQCALHEAAVQVFLRRVTEARQRAAGVPGPVSREHTAMLCLPRPKLDRQ